MSRRVRANSQGKFGAGLSSDVAGQRAAENFFTDADREVFLNTLAQVVLRYGRICHAYCLMANHYHLLVETPKGNLSLGMRQLNGVYTQSFNRLHKRVGHLFQGRSKRSW